MSPLALNQFLTLYIWFVVAPLLLFLLLIARFYQKFSGERTYFRLLLVPLVGFGAAAVRYASLGSLAGDVFADVMLGIAGLVLSLLAMRLYHVMVWKKRGQTSDG